MGIEQIYKIVDYRKTISNQLYHQCIGEQILSYALKNGVKWHKASIGFLYPAILGSTLYGVIDFLISTDTVYPEYFVLKFVTAIGITAVYYWDMLFTDTQDIARAYTRKLLILEVILIFSMFPAVHSALGNTNYIIISIPAAFFMSTKKLLCFFWEAAHERDNKLAKRYDMTLASTYLIIGLIALGLPVVGLVLTVLAVWADLLFYIFKGETFFEMDR